MWRDKFSYLLSFLLMRHHYRFLLQVNANGQFTRTKKHKFELSHQSTITVKKEGAILFYVFYFSEEIGTC